MISVKNIFECMGGNSGLTEEFIYNHSNLENRDYIVLSSSTKKETGMGVIPLTKIKGKKIKYFENKAGILVVRKGKAGKMIFLPQGKYTINDDAYILSLKSDFINKNHLNSVEKEELFLKYFIYKYQYEMYEYSNRSDNATWNKTSFFENCKIQIDSIENIFEFVKRFEKCELLKFKLSEFSDLLNQLNNKTIVIEHNVKNHVILNEILSYTSRNDCLSEEGIYNFYPNSKKTIDVLSGSINNIYYGKIDYYTPRIHKLEDRQCLHLITRGKAGHLTFVEKGTYATNTNAFLLYIKKEKWDDLNIKNEYQEKVYLKYLMLYLQPTFYEISSKSDVGVFPLTEAMNTLFIPYFEYNTEMDYVINIYDKGEMLNRIFAKAQKKLDELLDKQLVIEDKIF